MRRMVTRWLVAAAGLAALGASPAAGAEEAKNPVGPPTNAKALERWRQMRFGMFIHWGPVSLKGTEIGWSRGAQIPRAEYDSLYKRFNPEKFSAAEWVGLAKQAGMKYMVLTAKHHDGFCLWDSKVTDYDIMSTPFGRDVVRELAEECRRQGLMFCTYYSILDWYQPDYIPHSHGGPGYDPNRTPDLERYVTYMKAQLRELIQGHGPLGILWFDGEWEKTWTPARGRDLYDYCRSLQDEMLVNNRVGRGKRGSDGSLLGDYETPEQVIGAFSRDRPWETNMTICRQWAWKPGDEMKSLEQCLRTLVHVAGGDGNFLFNVGPMPDGRIEPRQTDRLREMGAWLGKYGTTIYGTRGGPFKPGKWGASTCKGNTIFVHIFRWPQEGKLLLPPIAAKVAGSSVLTGGNAAVSQTAAGVEIAIPQADRQAIDTIVALELDGPAFAVPPVDVRWPSRSLAYGKKATASNVFRKMVKVHGPAMALDDDSETRWATDVGTTQAWLEVDLGEPMTFDRARIEEWAERVQEFALEARTDGEWKAFHKGMRIAPEAEFAFPPVTARYIRLNILKASDGPTITEFQLLAPKDARPKAP